MLTLHYSKPPLQDQIRWQPLSEDAINQALAANKRVFIDVIADWCVLVRLINLTYC